MTYNEIVEAINDVDLEFLCTDRSVEECIFMFEVITVEFKLKNL